MKFSAWVGVACLLPAMAQDQPVVYTGAEVSEPVYPYVIDVNLADLPVLPDWQPGDPIKEIPRRKEGKPIEYTEPKDTRDPLLDLQDQVTVRGGTGFATPILNFNAQGFTGANPPDTTGDVGLTYYVQAINGSGTRYTIYNKADGTVAAGPFTMNTFAPCSGSGDPIVLYDEQADRWLLAEFGDGNSICVLISMTNDPIAGGWHLYGFNTPNFPDYPKLGVWNNSYILTTNESGPSPIYALDRASMLVGAAATSQRMTVPDLSGFGFQAVTPADLDGDAPPANAPALIMRHRDTEVHGGTAPGGDLLELWEYDVDWVTPANTTLTGPMNIEVTDFDSSLCGLTSFNCFQQMGSGTTLDPLREVIMFRLAYRNMGTHQALIGNFVTDVDGNDRGGVRWFELRSTGGAWSLFQEGTYAPNTDNHSRWMGGIAMDESGNIALGYNVSSSAMHPSLRYVGRLAGDPMGTMPQGEHSMVEGSAPNGSNRYGDYANMSIDPADGCTFWFTGMYNPATQWQTRITSFMFDTCGCEAAVPTSLTAMPNGANQIDLSWSAAAGASSYSVYRALGGCPGSGYQLVANGVVGTTFSDTSVSGNGTYSYVVTTYDGLLDCESGPSSCADATATGTCFLPPDFAGVAQVVDPQNPSCTLEINWAAASDSCASGGVVYNIYRSQTPGFIPGPGNLLMSCVNTTSFMDTSVNNGMTYYYVVRAEDMSGTGSGPCASGNEDTNTVELSGVPTGPNMTSFEDDMEGGSGLWTMAPGPNDPGGTDPWLLVTNMSASPVTSMFVDEISTVKDQTLQTASAVVLPPGTGALLQFMNRYNTESTFDGGVLEYSTDGGTSWFDILASNGGGVPADPSRFVQNGYNSTLSTGSSNPLPGRQAWSGDNSAFQLVIVDLADFGGLNVHFRWRFGCDSSVTDDGWYIDDVQIFTPTDCSDTGCPVDNTLWPNTDILTYVACVNIAP
ncbi:MAG: hypothetical protein KDC35_05585 [Acidobacteria bacterium]|nr:hypothetical protein [Acidobacteriota bacterium]